MTTFTRRGWIAAGIATAATMASSRLTAALLEPAGEFGTVTIYCKTLHFLKRRASMTPEQFVAHCRRVAAPKWQQQKGLAHLVIDFTTPTDDAPFDGIVERWWQSEQDWLRSAAAATDLDGLIAPDSLRVVTREVLIVPPADGAARPRVKTFVFVKRYAGTTEAEFAQVWRDEHAKVNSHLPTTAAYVLNILDRPHSSPMEWDGYATLWYRDMDVYNKLIARIEQNRLHPPAPSAESQKRPKPFIDWLILVGEEYVVC